MNELSIHMNIFSICNYEILETLSIGSEDKLFNTRPLG